MFAIIISGLVIIITILIEYCFSLFQILLTKPLSPTGAVEIDANEHIYAHPDCTEKLLDHKSFGINTTYEAILHGLKISPDRPSISYRQSSNEQFKSYTHKYCEI
jgi:hypothetical protein